MTKDIKHYGVPGMRWGQRKSIIRRLGNRVGDKIKVVREFRARVKKTVDTEQPGFKNYKSSDKYMKDAYDKIKSKNLKDLDVDLFIAGGKLVKEVVAGLVIAKGLTVLSDIVVDKIVYK